MVPGLETPSLLERDAELAAIAASVDDTPEARGRVM